jgi:hypothetical protein
MSSYDERRKALEAGYRARQEGRKEAQQRKEQVLDRQMELLEQERESAGRDAYIRQQQQLTALPEQLNAYGINGGGAETSLLKINTEYNQAKDRIRTGFEQAAGNVHQQRLDAESEYAAGLAADRADYYERLAQLAADIAEAQAAERARQEELKLAWAKLQQEKEKAEAANNKKQEQESGKNAADDEAPKVPGSGAKNTFAVPFGNGTQQVTRLNGELLLNPVKYDGSGSYYVVVDGMRMTPEEFQRAKKNGSIYPASGGLGTVMYRKLDGNRDDRLTMLKSLRR